MPIASLLPKIANAAMPPSGACRARAVPSAIACAAVAPGVSAAMALNIETPPGGVIRDGTIASVCRSGNATESGRMPTTV
jgi:hypothetical protein